ncbi:MAG TPA: GspL/Epsl periplasmic domain-containing protein [Thermodesulfovibrionales bacterium]|nr:GspL/Epsl periplasmic domain-containing protein [Thermodesulfovibrionales bacterium]
MKTLGFIDLTSRQSGEIYVFRGRTGGYDLEKTVHYTGEGSSQSPDLTGVGEFYLSIPLEMLNFRMMKLPFSEKEKLIKVIPFELESLLMDSADHVVFDAMVMGGGENGFDVLVAYVEKGMLREILTQLSLLSIDPQVVTSLELQAIAKNGTGDVALRLVDPSPLDRDARISAARSELSRHTINLRTGPFAYTRDRERVEKKLKVTFVLLLVLALAINAYLIFGIVSAKTETSSLKKDMRNMYTTLFPNEKRVADELYQMKSHMREIKEKGDALLGVYPLQFLLDLSQKTVPGVAFSEIGLDRDLSTMKGEASSMDDIDKMKTRLSASRANVSVSDIKPLPTGKILFTVVAKAQR